MAKRILIADDSATIQKAFGMTFGAEDVALTPARSADEGLALARQTHPDLVIADATMPGRSGYELCASIKADPGLRGTPVYILASTQQPYDDARGQQAGADGHFQKPWETSAFIDRVREALARGAGAATSLPPSLMPTPPPVVRPAAARTTVIPGAPPEDEYGEMSMDAHREAARELGSHVPTGVSAAAVVTPPPTPHVISPAAQPRPSYLGAAASAAPAHPHAPAQAPAQQGTHPGTHQGSSPSMRPSLIPGIRPGAIPPARPGATAPARPSPGGGPGAVPPRPASPMVGRTLMGLPAAANAPLPGSIRPGMPGMPGMTGIPGMPPAAPTPTRLPTGPAAPLAARPAVTAAVGSAVDQKMAAFAARGPEYEAIAKISREVIEQIVWEIVPELAELIIREHVEKQRGRL